MNSSSPPENEGLAEVIPLVRKPSGSETSSSDGYKVYYSVYERFPVIKLHSDSIRNSIDGVVTIPVELIQKFIKAESQYEMFHREVMKCVNASRSAEGRNPLQSN